MTLLVRGLKDGRKGFQAGVLAGRKFLMGLRRFCPAQRREVNILDRNTVWKRPRKAGRRQTTF